MVGPHPGLCASRRSRRRCQAHQVWSDQTGPGECLERLLQQCLAKQPGHRPQSAIDLARELQRIEVESGFSRTPIAVESDRPAAAAPALASDPDATFVKPITVIPASGPRAARIEASNAPDHRAEPAEPVRRFAVVWAVLGVTAAAAIVVLLVVVLRGGGGDDAPPTTSSSYTPGTLAPDALVAPPEVVGTRSGAAVTFTWTVKEGVQPGDSWEWKRTDTGDGRRTTETTLTLESPDRLCVQVRLIRGSYSSPWADRCVD